MADGPKYSLLRGGGEQCVLTPEQVRAIRLSLEPHAALARRYDVAPTTIQGCRSGHHYGPLADDELAALRRRKEPAFADLTISDYLLLVGSPYNQMWGLRPQDALERRDAAWECAHGRLAGDTTAPCGCFPNEPQRERRIPLHNKAGEVVAHAIVDEEDSERVSAHRWHRSSKGYPEATVWRGSRSVTLGMNRLVLDLPAGDRRKVDHINHDLMDNRKENLRAITHAENLANRSGPTRKKGRTSSYRGVSLHQSGRWRADASTGGRSVYLGLYDSEEEAAEAAAAFRREHMPTSEMDKCPQELDQPHEEGAAMQLTELARPESRDSKVTFVEPRIAAPGGLCLYPRRQMVTLNGAEIRLTGSEWRLLERLAKDPTRVFSKQELRDAMWGKWAYPADARTRSLETCVSRLRRKLGGGGLVVNVWGVGYALVRPLPDGPVACCPMCGRAAA